MRTSRISSLFVRAHHRIALRRASARGLAWYVLTELRFALFGIIGLFLVAAIGYRVLEGFAPVDAAYMAVITLSTVGYGEVQPLDTTGRLFTIGVIVAGFATLVYAASVLTNLFTSGEAQRHLRQTRGQRMRDTMSDHVIVIGFGRVGQATAHGVTEFGGACLVLERNAELEDAINAAGFVAMIGDATDERTLAEAGIDRARALIAAAEDDSINLIVTLTARALRSDLRIVSRVNELDWQDRIVRAGADIAQSPYRSYGTSLAASALSKAVRELHTIPGLGLATEEIEIGGSSDLLGRTIAEVSAASNGVLVLGLRRNEQFHRWSDLDGPMCDGDVLVALGTPEAVRQLAGAPST